MPDVALEHLAEGDWQPARAQDLLDPSEFTVLFTTQDAARETGPFHRAVAVRPAAEQRAGFRHLFGAASQAVLVRPDGHVALICPAEAAEARLQAYAEAHLGAAASTVAPTCVSSGHNQPRRRVRPAARGAMVG